MYLEEPSGCIISNYHGTFIQAGQGRAERPQKYSPVRRESRGTRSVVRGKGEGVGGGIQRDRHRRICEGSRASKKAHFPG